MSVSSSLRFLRRYVAAPNVTGAVAPSSARLGLALTRPFARRTQPARVLEVGAGTGAVTRVIGDLLGPQDTLDVCEIQPELADILERDVLQKGRLGDVWRDGRVRLLRCPVEEVHAPGAYDYIICGLPFTAFPAGDVRRIMRNIRCNLKPGGTFSYFEYVGLRRMSRTLGWGRKGRRVRVVSRVLDVLIRRHQVSKETVLLNLPPAYGRHWRFDRSAGMGVDDARRGDSK